MKRILLAAIAILLSAAAPAAEDLLKPQEAFQYTIDTDGGEIVVNWYVADG